MSGASASRTIKVLPTASGALLCSPAQRWPAKAGGSVLDYTVDLSAWLADADNDPIGSVTVSPESTAVGDVAVLMLQVDPAGVITCWLGYGVEYDDYAVDFSVATLGGRTLDFPVSLFIQQGDEGAPATTAPVPMSWSSGAVVTGPGLIEVVDGVQASIPPFVLTGVTNIITGGVAGGAVQIPFIIAGTITVLNRWPGTVATVLPPQGQWFEGMVANQPQSIAVNGNASFSVAQGSPMWRVS